LPPSDREKQINEATEQALIFIEASKRTVTQAAEFYKAQLDALMKVGLTRTEALEIIRAEASSG
jgi:hypothetical protein